MQLPDDKTVIAFAIKAMQDTFKVSLKINELKIIKYKNCADGMFEYVLLVDKYPLKIHIFIDKEKYTLDRMEYSFKSRIEFPKIEYFNIILQ